jgi:predicted membrane GTPase involved in stress response
MGGFLGAKGAEKSGQAQQQMYNYQAQVAQINATIDRQNAEYALNQGEQQAQQFGMKAAQQRGQIIADQGASNIAIGMGSAAEVVRSQNLLTRMDLTQIRSNAAKTAYDFSTKATMDLNQATLDTMAGANARTAGDINAASSILGTVGSVSSKWLQGKQMGMWGTSSDASA